MCSRQQSLQNAWPQPMEVAWEAGTSDIQTRQEMAPLAPAAAAAAYASASCDCESRPARLYTSSWPRSAMVPAAHGRAARGHQELKAEQAAALARGHLAHRQSILTEAKYAIQACKASQTATQPCLNEHAHIQLGSSAGRQR